MSSNADELELMYAERNGSKCQSCKQKIEKGGLRIGVSFTFQDRENQRKWYHLDCFSIPKKFKDVDPKEIPGYYDIKKSDKLAVITAFEEPTKKPTASELVADLQSSVSKQQPQQDIQSTKSKKQPESNTSNQSNKPTRVQPKRAAAANLRNGKSVYSTDEEDNNDEDDTTSNDDQDDGGDDDDDDDDDFDESDGSEFDTKRRTRKTTRQQKSTRSKSQPKTKKRSQSPKQVEKPKTKSKLKSKKSQVLGYTPDQLSLFKDYVEMFEKKTIEYLKALLSVNNQPKTGTKGDLVIKCADGKVLGQVPVCSSCGGGKLRFSYQDGTYKCPGYMDDDVFTHCGKKYSLEDIQREKWIDDIV